MNQQGCWVTSAGWETDIPREQKHGRRHGPRLQTHPDRLIIPGGSSEVCITFHKGIGPI